MTGIRVGKVARSALWLLAEFADSPSRAQAALNVLQAVIPDHSGNGDEDKVWLKLENGLRICEFKSEDVQQILVFTYILLY